jgi:hypothetical protein
VCEDGVERELFARKKAPQLSGAPRDEPGARVRVASAEISLAQR